MNIVKTSGLVGGSALGGVGGTGAVGYGVHTGTKATIGDVLKSELLEGDNHVEEWKKLESKLRDSQDNHSWLPKNRLGETISGSVLPKWCREVKGYAYSSLVYENRVFNSMVKKYCIFEIQEKLLSHGYTLLDIEFRNSGSDFESSFERLKSLSGTENGDVNEKALGLKLIKDGSLENTEGGRRMRRWCREVLRKGYHMESDNLYKLAKHLCTKS